MKNLEKNMIFVAAVADIFNRNYGTISEEAAIYAACDQLKGNPDLAGHKFTREDVTYVAMKLSRIFGFEGYDDFDEMVFYNDNLNAVLSHAF